MIEPPPDPAHERRLLRQSVPWIVIMLIGAYLLMAGLKLRKRGGGVWPIAGGVVATVIGVSGLVRVNSRMPGER